MKVIDFTKNLPSNQQPVETDTFITCIDGETDNIFHAPFKIKYYPYQASTIAELQLMWLIAIANYYSWKIDWDVKDGYEKF